jgi:methyl-accepting chemotaxis protein
MKNTEKTAFVAGIYERSNKMIRLFLISYFLFGILLGFWYKTLDIALLVGGICLAMYFLSEKLFPEKRINQYVASGVVGVFTAQYIYQMHGMFEMHFFAFIGSALMITYQNWKALIPVSIVVAVHHAIFGYLQYQYGFEGVYFSQINFDLEAYTFHLALAVIVFFICALWSYQLEQQQQSIIMLEKLNENSYKNIEFAMNLSHGNLDAEFNPQNGDLLAESLLEIRNQLNNKK